MRGTRTEEDVQRVSDAVDAAVHTHIDIGDKKRELEEDADELDKQGVQSMAKLETIARVNERIDAIPRNEGAALCLGMFSECKLLYVLIALCRDNTQEMHASRTRHYRRRADYYRTPESSDC